MSLDRPARRSLEPAAPDRARGGLRRDEGGATMVMGIFMAVFAVGMLYYLMGLGETLLYREQVQDVADTASFGAAVIHARGMNMLACLNIIMAACAAVAAAYDIVTSSLQFAMVYALVVCIASEGSSDACDYIETYADEAEDAADEADEVEDDVEDLLETLHSAAEAIRRGMPLAAQAKASAYGDRPPVEQIFLLPVGEELAAEDDDDDWPCDEKVAPPAQMLSALGIVDYTISAYLFVGWATGLATAEAHAGEWCEDGTFQRVLEDAELGGEDFQLRAFAIADPPYDRTRAWVGIAKWGQDAAESSTLDSLDALGRFGLSQAEYYFDGDVDRKEWLWAMRWRGRLRRFRLEGSASDAVSACESAGAAGCGALSRLTSVRDAIVH